MLHGWKYLQGPPEKTENLHLLTINACGVTRGSSPELRDEHENEADLDKAPDAPSRGRALASAGVKVYAGNHQGMPCTVGQSQEKENEADLDRAPDALEVLRHIQWQDDIFLQDPLGLSQTSYVIPGHARACIQHVPTMQTCAASQCMQICNASHRKQPDQVMRPGPWPKCLLANSLDCVPK